MNKQNSKEKQCINNSRPTSQNSSRIPYTSKLTTHNSSLTSRNSKGITLVALVVTMVLHYDKVKKCSNSNGFLLSSI